MAGSGHGLDLGSAHHPPLQVFTCGGIEIAAAGDQGQRLLASVADDVVLDDVRGQLCGRVWLRPLHRVLVVFPILSDDADNVAGGQVTNIPEDRWARGPVGPAFEKSTGPAHPTFPPSPTFP